MKYTILVAMLLSCMQVTFSQVSKPTLLAEIKTPKKTAIVRTVIPSNVEFPDILADHIEESTDYIEKFSKNRREYIIRTHQRGKKLFAKVEGIFNKFNLPKELKVLMALESAFNPTARSRAGAYGYWQFMDAPAREYGLTIASSTPKSKNVKKGKKGVAAKSVKARPDERSNLSKSTHAAARYLVDRKRNLGEDWLLVVASYNWGVGNVWQAIKKTGNKDATFWDIKKYLPAETRAYVMNFIAMNVIFNNYDNFLKNKLQFEEEIVETVESISNADAETTL